MAGPTPDFWQQRFDRRETGWDRGAPGPQLDAWLADGSMQAGRIVVPGCGSGWELVALARQGFEVTGIDYTPAAVALARARCEEAGVKVSVVQADVLQWQPPEPVDAIYEQTCLCALHPDHWVGYAGQLHRWLRPGGQLFALFMQMPRETAITEGVIHGPPYHCDIHAMRALLPATRWTWPAPPYAQVRHPNLAHELALTLTRV